MYRKQKNGMEKNDEHKFSYCCKLLSSKHFVHFIVAPRANRKPCRQQCKRQKKCTYRFEFAVPKIWIEMQQSQEFTGENVLVMGVVDVLIMVSAYRTVYHKLTTHSWLTLVHTWERRKKGLHRTYPYGWSSSAGRRDICTAQRVRKSENKSLKEWPASATSTAEWNTENDIKIFQS